MGTQLKLFWMVAAHEARVLMADRSLWLVSALLTLLIGYALYNGLAIVQARDVDTAKILHQDDERVDKTIAQLRRVMAGTEAPEPFANPADPFSVGRSMAARNAVIPTSPLAIIAFGQSDMIPNYYKVGTGRKISFMYDSEIENPWNLLTGRFDLAFVLTYLFPLLIFALSYNLLAVEREQGTLRMLLSQPLGLRTLVLGKIAVRAGALLGIALLLPVLVLLIVEPQTRAWNQGMVLLLWMGMVAAYGLFWFALAGMVNALAKSSALNALILIGSWVLLVLVVPLLLNLLVAVASPAPSRAELATQTRLISNDTLNQNDALLGSEYQYVGKPEVLLPRDGKFDVSPRLRAFFLMSQTLDNRIQGELDRFDTQLAGQQTLVDRFGFVSPAILMHEGMASMAGNGSTRYLHFQNQVEAFHEVWKKYFEPRVLGGIAITEADFAQMPRWKWQEQDAQVMRSDALIRLLQMLAVAMLLIIIGLVKLRRYPAV